MDWPISIQRWPYGCISDGLRAADGVTDLSALAGAAFAFGVVHALMPGHGKSVLVSYHAGRPGRFLDGVVTGTLLALTHVGLAIVLVPAGVMAVSRTLALGGRAPAFEIVSAALITVFGAYLLVHSSG